MKTFVARQPIFDRKQDVIGYELLFRATYANHFGNMDPDIATSRLVVESLMDAGLESLTGGRLGFVNAPRRAILDDLFSLLPPVHTVIEILETVEPDDEVVAACHSLKERGYRIALDDYVEDEKTRRLIDVADIIKVDILATSHQEQAAIIQRHRLRKIEFLAEKVETPEAFRRAMDFGYRYFQGFFFEKPAMVARHAVTVMQQTCVLVMKELHKPILNFNLLETILQHDVALSYRLLRYINSAHFGLRNKVSSLRQAMAFLGEKEMRKWLAVMAMSGLGDDKPDELLVSAMIRAKFCEELARRAGRPQIASKCFLTGMFSVIDAILDRPISEVMAEIPIDDDIRAALMGVDNEYRRSFEVIIAYEHGEWNELFEKGNQFGINVTETSQIYVEAVAWGEEFMRLVKGEDD